MTYRKLSIIMGAILVVAIGVTWGYLFSVKPEADARTAAHYAELEEQRQAEEASQAAEEAKQAGETSEYSIPPIKIPKKDPKPQKQADPTNEAERTGQNTGDVSKPEAPPPPEIPEEQKKDPTSKPEYTPEQVKPNQQEPKNNAPQDGDRKTEDGKKYVYVAPWGWIEDHGGGNKGEVVNNDGWEDSPTVGIM